MASTQPEPEVETESLCLAEALLRPIESGSLANLRGSRQRARRLLQVGGVLDAPPTVLFETAIYNHQFGIQGPPACVRVYAVDDKFQKAAARQAQAARDERGRPLIDTFFARTLAQGTQARVVH